MKILIKGAGDLATGVAVRLYGAGFRKIIMTDIAVPTTVRRTVAFSKAVYERQAEVEGILGVLVHDMKEAKIAFEQGEIAIMVDPKAEIIEKFCPDVVVDAILAKKNIGTTINDAKMVIGVGPGFCAGKDCHAVVETKRGHYLGKVITKGEAIANTGIPGLIGGFGKERIIRATEDGKFYPVAKIGDVVEQGDLVANVKHKDKLVPVYALISGVVRGMLQEGVEVVKGMKSGDIDPRCEVAHCFSVSDKARAVGGGVLEAICAYEHRK